MHSNGCINSFIQAGRVCVCVRERKWHTFYIVTKLWVEIKNMKCACVFGLTKLMINTLVYIREPTLNVTFLGVLIS